jgi:hypothetical protein
MAEETITAPEKIEDAAVEPEANVNAGDESESDLIDLPPQRRFAIFLQFLKRFKGIASPKISILIEFFQDKWNQVDEDKRKKILPIAGGIILVLMIGFIWKMFFTSGEIAVASQKQAGENQTLSSYNSQKKIKEPVTTVPADSLDYKEINNQNRFLPALNTSDLESWSGLKSDRYEMKKRGQIKTIPQQITEGISGIE